jgi:hypothetical protein
MNEEAVPSTGITTVVVEGTPIDPVGVTRAQAASLLSISIDQVDDLIKAGYLKTFLIGTNQARGRIRVTLASIQALPEVRPSDPAAREARNARRA